MPFSHLRSFVEELDRCGQLKRVGLCGDPVLGLTELAARVPLTSWLRWTGAVGALQEALASLLRRLPLRTPALAHHQDFVACLARSLDSAGRMVRRDETWPVRALVARWARDAATVAHHMRFGLVGPPDGHTARGPALQPHPSSGPLDQIDSGRLRRELVPELSRLAARPRRETKRCLDHRLCT